jgi:hypothetical protein
MKMLYVCMLSMILGIVGSIEGGMPYCQWTREQDTGRIILDFYVNGNLLSIPQRLVLPFCNDGTRRYTAWKYEFTVNYDASKVYFADLSSEGVRDVSAAQVSQLPADPNITPQLPEGYTYNHSNNRIYEQQGNWCEPKRSTVSHYPSNGDGEDNESKIWEESEGKSRDQSTFYSTNSPSYGPALNTILFLGHAFGKEALVHAMEHSRFSIKPRKIGGIEIINNHIATALLEGGVMGGLNGVWNEKTMEDKIIWGSCSTIGNVLMAYVQELIRQPVEWCVPSHLKNKAHSLLGHKGYYVLRVIARDALRLGIRNGLYYMIKKLILIEDDLSDFEWAGLGLQWDSQYNGSRLIAMPIVKLLEVTATKTKNAK